MSILFYLSSWITVGQMELCLNPDLIKKWKKMTKAEAKKAKKRGEDYDPSNSLEATFLRNLMVEFLVVYAYA